MEILWWSNSPTVKTGYGTQTAQVVSRIVDDGHHVEVLANYGVEGVPTWWRTQFGHDVKMHPRGLDAFSRDVMSAYWLQFQSEYPDAIMVGLADVFVIPDDITSSVPLHVWVPLEHTPLPPDVHHAFKRDDSITKPIAMSQFGLAQLQSSDIDATYIPHAIEAEFQPTEGGGELMGVPDDAFVVGIVQANKGASPERKQFTTAMLAFQKLKKAHDDAVLYIHADPIAPQSITLRNVAKTLGLEGRVFFPDPLRYRTWGYDDGDLASIYTRTDILAAASMGEGFGLTPLEAAACGTPSIVSNFSAQPELAFVHSYVVDGQLTWHEGRKSFLFQPFVQSVADAMLDAYDNPMPFSQAAVEFAARYDADRVFSEYWIPYLASLR